MTRDAKRPTHIADRGERNTPKIDWTQPRYPTIERLKQAREINRWTQADLAERTGLTLPVIRYLEAGRRPITRDELGVIGMVTGFPPAFFFREPPPQFPLGSLLFQCAGFVCDPCERETGEEVDAYDHCAACGEDLCPIHVHTYSGPQTVGGLALKGEMKVTLCPACHAIALKGTPHP